MSPPPKTVSIVIPMFNEVSNADRLCSRMTQLVMENPNYRLDFVLVDDGSSDGCAEAVLEVCDPNVDLEILRLSRNFGAQAACTAGLEYCRGDAAILVGADLQEPASLISGFIAEWEGGHDVVWGIREERVVDKRRVAKSSSDLFSRLFNRYSELKNYPAQGPAGVLVDRRCLDALKLLEERHRNLYGLIAWVGFESTTLPYRQSNRVGGESKWTKAKLFKLAIDSFVEFSFAPVRAITYCGLVTAVLGFIYAIFVAASTLFSRNGPVGWPTVIVLVLILGGIQLVMLGILGEYIWRGTDEARRRPVYVLNYVIRSKDRGSAKPSDSEQRFDGTSEVATTSSIPDNRQ